jgi:hypothetical protein
MVFDCRNSCLHDDVSATGRLLCSFGENPLGRDANRCCPCGNRTEYHGASPDYGTLADLCARQGYGACSDVCEGAHRNSARKHDARRNVGVISDLAIMLYHRSGVDDAVPPDPGVWVYNRASHDNASVTNSGER